MRRSLLLFAVLALGAPAAAAVPSPIQPGYWTSVNRVTSPISTKTEEKRCLTVKDVEKFMMGPENRHYDCTYPTRVFEAGRIKLKGVCTSKKGRRVEVTAKGNYTATSFHLDADVKTKFAGLTIGGSASTDAKRIGDVCPPPPPKATKGKKK